ncbi:MAG: sel1 repeat family protein [Opitutaceae bacterium]|jgi:TPR repeat protein|nr:sel1 repeat family protein [Opitutaceae bacterium]
MSPRHTAAFFIRRLLLCALLPALALGLAAAPKAKASKKQKNAAPASEPANAAGDGDSAPKLISTTGGDDKRWPSLDALKKAAEAGDPEACFELGQMYLAGAGPLEKNITRGLLNLETAAARGHANAAFRLGKIYADGELTPNNPEASLKYYRIAANAGVSEARHNLGAAYATGRGVKRDYAEGLAWLILAAKTNPEAVASERQLREFLTKTKHPGHIAAGEKRALEITAQLIEDARQKQQAPEKTKPAAPAPPAITPPKLEITPVAPPPILLPPPQ